MPFEIVAVDLVDVRDRLDALGVFTAVSDVVDASEAMEAGAARTPAAFVAMASERAAPNRTQGLHDQAVDATLAVLIAVASQRADGRRTDAVEALRRPVIGALAGFTPAGASKALDYSGYRIIRMGGGLIWCECSFVTGWRLRLPAS